jgi:DNA-binding XRE family transcriptional regulator
MPAGFTMSKGRRDLPGAMVPIRRGVSLPIGVQCVEIIDLGRVNSRSRFTHHSTAMAAAHRPVVPACRRGTAARRRAVRGARAMLQLSQVEFSKRVPMSKTNLNHIENGSDPRRSTLEAIRATFEAAGIEFIEDNGVRLRKAVK